MKKKKLKPRRLIEEILFVGSHGGAHTTKKGKKGYKRSQNKEALRDFSRNPNASIFLFFNKFI